MYVSYDTQDVYLTKRKHRLATIKNDKNPPIAERVTFMKPCLIFELLQSYCDAFTWGAGIRDEGLRKEETLMERHDTKA